MVDAYVGWGTWERVEFYVSWCVVDKGGMTNLDVQDLNYLGFYGEYFL